MSVGAEEFRVVLGRFATGVTVVTTHDGDTRVGITVNAFTSVSLDPPLVLVCVDRRSYVHEALLRSGVFAANMLTAEQSDLSACFATHNATRFERFCDVPTHAEATGAPVFDECLAWVDCRIVNVFPGGDHTIFLAQVEAVGGHSGVEPLLYYRGRYGQLDALPTEQGVQ